MTHSLERSQEPGLRVGNPALQDVTAGPRAARPTCLSVLTSSPRCTLPCSNVVKIKRIDNIRST